MAVFDVYVVTVYSRTQYEVSREPVGRIDAGHGKGVSFDLKTRAHHKFGLKANQYPSLRHAKTRHEHKVRGERYDESSLPPPKVVEEREG